MYAIATFARSLWHPFRVQPLFSLFVTQGALRDPGLCSGTPSAFALRTASQAKELFKNNLAVFLRLRFRLQRPNVEKTQYLSLKRERSPVSRTAKLFLDSS